MVKQRHMAGAYNNKAKLTLLVFGILVVVLLLRVPVSNSKTFSTRMESAMIIVCVFNEQGILTGPVPMNKVVRSEDEWRKRLTPEQYNVTRNSGTERPFCGNLLDNKKEGVYTCVCCGLPLFTSNAKFDSGTGWPSFFQPICKENVTEKSDESHGMLRSEINCTRCDAHLGHVFDDGPRPTGLRFCLNSESLEFTEKGSLAKLAETQGK